jgi:NADH-quinone oxidoreductase subunit L
MARLSAGMRQLQTGYIRNYALMFLLGVVLLIGYFALR